MFIGHRNQDAYLSHIHAQLRRGLVPRPAGREPFVSISSFFSLSPKAIFCSYKTLLKCVAAKSGLKSMIAKLQIISTLSTRRAMCHADNSIALPLRLSSAGLRNGKIRMSGNF